MTKKIYCVVVFLFTVLVSTAFADVSKIEEMMIFDEYSDGKFYSQFVDLFNKEYGITGVNNNVIIKKDNDFLVSKIASDYKSKYGVTVRNKIVTIRYWLNGSEVWSNSVAKGNTAGDCFLTVVYFDKDGKYLSASWLVGI